MIVLKFENRNSKNLFDFFQTLSSMTVYNSTNSQFFFSIRTGSFSNIRDHVINLNIVHFSIQSFDRFFEKHSKHFEQHFVNFFYFSEHSENASENENIHMKRFEFLNRLSFEHFKMIIVFKNINIYSKKKLIRKFDSNFDISKFVKLKIVFFLVLSTRKSR